MISAAVIKFIQSLRQKKYRDKHHVFVAEGHKIVAELLTSKLQIRMICATKPWADRYGHKIPASLEIWHVTPKQLERISLQKTPNQVLSVVNKPTHEITSATFKNNLVLVLDKLQDPGNLGTIIRTADWFGIRNIICTEGTADVYNPKVIQASMGSFMRVNIYYTNPLSVLESAGMPVYGAFLEGRSLFETRLQTPAVIVIGNESQGISPELAQHVTQKLTIPPHYDYNRSGKAESLNASVAAGVIMAYLQNSAHTNTHSAT